MIQINTLVIMYLVIGLLFAIGELKVNPIPPKTSNPVLVICLLVLVLTICWGPIIITKAIWGKK
jgi:hypothetical protein